jgi:hypothetical protein
MTSVYPPTLASHTTVLGRAGRAGRATVRGLERPFQPFHPSA